MNITIRYEVEDYVADLGKTAEIKIKILYKSTLLLNTLAAFVVLSLLAAGVKTEKMGHFLIGTLLVIFSVIILLLYVGQFIITNSKKRHLRSLADKERSDNRSFAILTFTETMFAIRTRENYRENSWNNYESYLVIDEFIFFIEKDIGLHQALFMNKKQSNKEEYEKLIAFLGTKVPVWKP